VLGAGVLWLATGSALTLWFALLAPVIAIAGMLDGRRGARRSRRRELRAHTQRMTAARLTVRERHEAERSARWGRHPDVAHHRRRPTETWRAVPGREESLVVGCGTADSGVRVEGAADDPETATLREEAHAISGVPVVVPVRAGVAVIGPPPLAASVVRGLVLQLCLNLPPGRLRLGGEVPEGCERLPHRAATTGLEVRIPRAGEAADTGDAVVATVVPGEPPPPRCAAVLTLLSPERARLDYAEMSQVVEVEPVCVDDAEEIARGLSDRAAVTHPSARGIVPSLPELLRSVEAPRAGSLSAVVGVDGAAPVSLDLLADGPHAVVIGVTGSGKSELLITWIVSLAAARSAQEISFLLVDFKGGRSFDTLRALPHVTGVLTDLDEAASLRAIESLRAEMRHRERVLASIGARDVAEASGTLGRLVVVVDEYAALVAAHPVLHDLFADIAARGRALGVHLILASQRAAGAFRDAVLANAPLRLALRVTDRTDSRAVLGVDDAASLSGQSDDLGLCLVRGPTDAAPRTVRVALCPPGAAEAVAAPAGEPARRPWLPPLAERIPLTEGAHDGAVVVGVADEPEMQRQVPRVLSPDEPGLIVLGAAGTGKTSALRALARQVPRVVVVPPDPEAGWDALTDVENAPPATAIVMDDLDLLLARLGPDHGAHARERLEQLAREARSRGIRMFVSAQRMTGAAGRIVDAIPRRLLLQQATRADYLAVGGESADFARLPPGRGHLDGVLIQGLWVEPDETAAGGACSDIAAWVPARHPVAFVAPDGPRTRRVLGAWTAGGVDVATVSDTDASPRAGRVLWGTPDAWLGQWRSLTLARASGLMVIDAVCGPQYRALTNDHDLPPYVRPHASRAWLRQADGTATRILLPS
jgi:S-DNA-T family DNA segregation ATPase FtsK/SpoIIIE